ncbi:hypothetical protein [Pseudomonas sp. 32_A]|uniref:hypothetical protein n=1 Tax=Pseudomonas sp. 32_A TaxID=2813559 RepID=UPI001FAEB77A|nr:hypothetical protein [Pseudomonas sp. 32_A]
MNTDPRDLFISLNPLGLDERELEKDSSGFADDRTHSDYLVYLAGYKAGAVDGEKSECRRQRPINAEGCKPESTFLPFDMPCAEAATSRSLDKAEGFKPDLAYPLLQLQLQRQGEPTPRLIEVLPAIRDVFGECRSTQRHVKCNQIRQRRKSTKWKSYVANVVAKRAMRREV